MSNFLQNELVDMIFVLGESNKNCLLARRIYGQRYPDRRQPREESFRNLLERFESTGSVGYPKNERAKVVTNEENEFRVLVATVENPHVSIPKLSDNLEISQTSVRRMLKKNKFHPYHVQLHQELKEQDFQNRINFCQWVQQQLNANENFISGILFTDECTFHRNGFVNRHNFHFYSNENPHQFRLVSQNKWSVNVWAGIFGGTIVGPFFFNGTLTGVEYHNFLENELYHLLENVPLAQRRGMYFQQDGAPPHHARIVTQWLNSTFHENWIGRQGPIPWPARSPDITPLDFFLWGFVKNKVYEEEPTTAENMKLRIRNVFATITPNMLDRVEASFIKRIQYCLNQRGRQFEHLI